MTALYVRVSKDDGRRKESESIANQKTFLEHYCKARGITDYEFFADDGYSGLQFERPAFREMLSRKDLKTVITKDLSRLGRDYILTGYYIEKYFPSAGIRYIAINDNIDTGGKIDDLSGFRAVMNDMYAKDISKKVRTALTAKKQAGRFIGSSAPFGYRRENGVLIPVKEQAEVVKTIFKLFLKENNLSAVARELNRMDVATPSMVKGGKKNLWSDVMIHRILENPTYAGHLTQNKTRRINYKVKKREKLPENLWICVKNTHEPIVPEKEFETVKNKLTKRGETGIIK